MDSWPCSQLSLPEGGCPNWLCLKQPCKRLTIHVWFPGCTYCLSGEEGLEGWGMISLRLRLAVCRCPRPSWGPEPLTCGSARLSPPRLVVSRWHPCVLAPEQGEVVLHWFPALLYHLGHQIRHAVYADVHVAKWRSVHLNLSVVRGLGEASGLAGFPEQETELGNVVIKPSSPSHRPRRSRRGSPSPKNCPSPPLPKSSTSFSNTRNHRGSHHASV